MFHCELLRLENVCTSYEIEYGGAKEVLLNEYETRYKCVGVEHCCQCIVV